MRTLLTAAFVLSLTGSAFAQCQLPPNFNPYTDQAPDGCRNDGFVPYQVAAGAFKPTAFLWAGASLNAETLAYLDITNGSTYAQRVDVEIQLADRTILRTYVLPPKPVGLTFPQAPTAAPFKSIDLGSDPELRGLSVTFSLQVTFERIGSATLTMRPALAPWSSAITPTPRILDLPAVQH